MKIAMIILAAGFSERMDAFKPLLPVLGESALLRAVRLGRLAKVHCISVVTGYRHEDVEAALLSHHTKNIRHIYNNRYRDGMFSSVIAGIHSLPNDIDGFFLLPVDNCAVRHETLEMLIAAFILSGGKTVVYPTYHGKRGHPPLIPYSFAADVKSYDGTDGMRGYLSPFPFEEAEVDDPGILMDMDTQRDCEALIKYLEGQAYHEKNCDSGT